MNRIIFLLITLNIVADGKILGQVADTVQMQLNSSDNPFTMRLEGENIIFGFCQATDTLMMHLPTFKTTDGLVLQVFVFEKIEPLINIKGQENGSGVTFLFPIADFTKSCQNREYTLPGEIFQLKLSNGIHQQNIFRFEILK